MQKSFFKDIRRRIIPYLKEAESEVVVAMAWFTSGELFQALMDCRKRGVRVELILLESEINFMYYAPDFNRLIEAGGVVRIACVANGFMHHKFCVIDNRVVITGSYNWTYYAETRNLENIVISDDPSLVESYRAAFRHLAEDVEKVHESPRLEWDQLEACQNMDFDSLNYEIEMIAREHNLPRKTVVKSNTTITVESRPMQPVSRYDVGISVDNGNLLVLIPSGSPLPYVSEKKHFYNYNDQREGINCTVACECSDGAIWTVAERDITEVTSSRDDFELNIEVQFNLMPNGDLLAEVRCAETSKVMSVKTTNLDLVGYED